MSGNDLEFIIVGGDEHGGQTESDRRLIRSRAARHQWRQYALQPRTNPRVPGSGETHMLAFVGIENIVPPEHLEFDHALQSPLTALGQGRVDPFRTYPAEWRPYFPAVIDHYLMSMAVDIPEIDQPGNNGLMRTGFFPLVMTEPSTFLAVVLLASSHYSSVHHNFDAVNLLELKQEAIKSVNEGLQSPNKGIDDALIGAVAKFASYEAMYGNVESYMVHMRGLVRMIDMRGGIDSLGLNGLLRRIILWIDVNSSFLNGAPLFFPEVVFTSEQPMLEPNPIAFIGDFR